MLIAERLKLILKTLPDTRLAIAFSGGGDSTALVHMCRNLSQKPLILIVDHALRTGSNQEAETAKLWAESLGLETRILHWTHDGVSTGIQEKARTARYALMGQVCRDVGVEFLLTAHSKDDQAETLLMRYDKGTGWRGAAGMMPSIYAPLWPHLAGVTLLRPLLSVSRTELRAYNRQNNLNWIEDPSNQNESFERIRARKYLAGKPALARHLHRTSTFLQNGLALEKQRLVHLTHERVKIDENGLIRIYGALPPRLWECIVRAASGTGGPVEKRKILNLMSAVSQPDFKGQTLGGALVIAEDHRLCVGRDPAAYKGRSNNPAVEAQSVSAGQSVIWDGRFEVTAEGAGGELMTFAQARRLYPSIMELSGDTNHNLIFNLPVQAFAGSHPVVIKDGNVISNIGLRPSKGVRITSLVARRLHHRVGDMNLTEKNSPKSCDKT